MVKGNRFLKHGKILGIGLLLLGIYSIGFGFQEQVVPVVDGRLGRCSAEFTVTDADKTPIYDAKIDVTLRYGFLGLRKMSLQVGTNSDGRARVAGLPDDNDKTFQFEVTSGTLHKTVLMNTSDKCDAEFGITLDE